MKWKRGIFKFFTALFALFLFLILTSNAYLSRMKFVKLPTDNESLGIKEEEINNENLNKEKLIEDKNQLTQHETPITQEKPPLTYNLKTSEEKYDVDYLNGVIRNIVLLGSDRRNKNEASHTDTIIVLTIDGVHKKLKVSSIMRDTYVNVHGHGKTKINHAYAYGGPKLVIRTLNENFGLNIRDFVFIDFNGFEKLIDSVGGVEVEVKKNELKETNYRIKEMANIKKVRPKYIKAAGLQILNGQQALAYSRIRKVGNGDFDRTDRQRRVLTALFKKIHENGILKYPFIVANILPYTETSLSKTEILKIGTYILSSGIKTVEQKRFPDDRHSRGKIIDKVWYLVTDIKATRKQMHEFIYERESSA